MAPSNHAVRGFIRCFPILAAMLSATADTEGTRALSPAESLLTIRVHAGLIVELVASEPLVQDPVAIDWGADGRLWVCEMNDYPTGLDGQWQPGGRVKVLTDADGNGTYDRATVVVEGLPFPTGVMAWGRGALICAAPDILYVEDTDGDGRADKVEKLYTGFATENYQARVNGLCLGLDNWIHGANGLLGGVIESRPSTFFATTTPRDPVPIRGRDFRFHPSTGAFEAVSGLTQQGRVRDDWGNWFGNDNSRALLQYPWDDRQLRRNPHVATPDPVRFVPHGEDPGRLYPASELRQRFNDPEAANRVTSACGLGIYRDSGFMPELYGNAFVCEPVHNLVHREIISFDGILASSRRAPEESNSEFLAATDPWFRPVQARTGPDGALYVVDLYRFMVEHPRWIPAERLAKLEVRAGSDRGRIYRVRPANKAPRTVRDLTRLDAPELAAALDSANGTERDRVHIELLRRQDARSVSNLTTLVLGDPPRLVPPRAGARGSSGAAVRIQALSALAGMGKLTRGVLDAAGGDEDSEVRRHVLRLYETHPEPIIEPRLDRSSALHTRWPRTLAEQVQLALTLGAWKGQPAGGMLANLALGSLTNHQLRTAILSSALHHAPAILAPIQRLPADAPGRQDWLTPLLGTLASTLAPDELADQLAATVHSTHATLDEKTLSSIAVLAERLRPETLRSRSGEAFRGFPERWERVIASARELAASPGATENARDDAVRILGLNMDLRADLERVVRLSATDASPRVRRTALQMVRRQPISESAPALLGHWPRTPPAARAGVVAFLLEREPGARALLEAVRARSIQPTEIDLADRQRLLASPDVDLRRLASECLAMPPAPDRAAVITRYAPVARLTGRSDAGKPVFDRNCAACHRIDGVGFEVGPDLVPLRAKDLAYWLKNVLDPNAVIEPRFIPYEAELNDGRIVSGLIKGDTGTRMDLIAGNGVATTIHASEIRELRASRLSLMPEGFESAIPPQDMADLFAYLRPAAQPSSRGPIPWQASPDGLMRDARTVAGFILDPTQPEAQRQNAVQNNPQFAATLIAEFTRDLTPGTPEEYVRIPWIWRVAIACGRRNEAGQIREVLLVALPATHAPLHDWQAVVIGGGIINGMSQREPWPGRRLDALVAGDAALAVRWRRALELAAGMADDARVPPGTRYDALRMLGAEPLGKCGPQFLKYLGAGSPSELQMGSVSGLADVPDPQASRHLMDALGHLSGRNRDLALDALLVDDAHCELLLKALAAKQLDAAALGESRITLLRQHRNPRIRERAQETFGAGNR